MEDDFELAGEAMHLAATIVDQKMSRPAPCRDASINFAHDHLSQLVRGVGLHDRLTCTTGEGEGFVEGGRVGHGAFLCVIRVL